MMTVAFPLSALETHKSLFLTFISTDLMTDFVTGGRTSISISLMAVAQAALVGISLIPTDRSATKLSSVF